MTVIKTVLGNYFPLAHPEDYVYPIEEIAWALGKLNRFTGHTLRDYSVAEHCVKVSFYVPPHLALEGLMHDAEEAYYGDVSSPLKRLIGAKYKRLANRCNATIRKQYGLPKQETPSVKEHDGLALRIENGKFMARAHTSHPDGFREQTMARWSNLGPTMSSEDATDAFLLRFYDLISGPDLRGWAPIWVAEKPGDIEDRSLD